MSPIGLSVNFPSSLPASSLLSADRVCVVEKRESGYDFVSTQDCPRAGRWILPRRELWDDPSRAAICEFTAVSQAWPRGDAQGKLVH